MKPCHPECTPRYEMDTAPRKHHHDCPNRSAAPEVINIPPPEPVMLTYEQYDKLLSRNPRPRSALENVVDPRTRPVQMTLKDAEIELSNVVYAATELYERLEGAGLVDGNGHHMRQRVVAFAVGLLAERWNKGKK